MPHGQFDAKVRQTDASSPGISVWFGVLLGPVFSRYVEGYSFGRLACELVERQGALAYKAKTYFAMEMVALWAKPLETALDYIRRAFHAGVEGGDLAFACYSCNHTITDLLVRGDHLDAIWQESVRNLEFASKARFRDVVDIIVSQQRFIDNMRGKTGNFSTFSSAEFDENRFESQLHRRSNDHNGAAGTGF